MPERAKMVAWIDPQQAPLLDAVVRASGLELLAVGCDDPTTGRRLAEPFDAATFDDLRHGLERFAGDADLVWLACAVPPNLELVRLFRRSSARILTSEPWPDSTAVILKEPALGDVVSFTPLFMHSDGAAMARSMLPEFGRPHCVNISMSADSRDGSLRARLFDAMHTTAWLCGEAVQIAAVRHDSQQGAQWLTANVLCESGRSAVLSLHRCAGRWSRHVRVFGEPGEIRMSDTACCWDDNDRDAPGEPTSITSHGEQIARHLSRVLSATGAVEPPVEPARVLAMCDAALLSCRTLQVETPGRMIQALAGP